MAEILARLLDGAEGHLKGDPVWVAPDNHGWGNRESLQVWLSNGNERIDWPGKFIIIKVPGTKVADLAFLLEPDQIDVERDKLEVREVSKLDIRARNQVINIDSLPKNQAENDEMLLDGEIVITLKRLNDNSSIKLSDTTLEDEVFNRVKLRDPSITRL
jgi:hypothetical protein